MKKIAKLICIIIIIILFEHLIRIAQDNEIGEYLQNIYMTYGIRLIYGILIGIIIGYEKRRRIVVRSTKILFPIMIIIIVSVISWIIMNVKLFDLQINLLLLPDEKILPIWIYCGYLLVNSETIV